MNVYELLFIDALFAIAVIPVLFLIQSKHKNIPFFRFSNKKEPIVKTTINLPNREKLLSLEKLARIQGSGIEFESLVGTWKFLSVWKKDTHEEDLLFSSLLRVFSAKLELKKKISTNNNLGFSIISSIKFGLFSIKFCGSGYLKGKQPLLPFFFNLIELKSGSTILLSRSIREPIEKEKSFFALIGSGESDRWLSARVQRGALILWLKDN